MRTINVLIALTVVIATVVLNAPLVRAGSPFLYLEDDAHHFNRVVEMARSGDLNPHYFNKPSLHFYLRIPIVRLAAYRAIRSGELSRIQDVRTRDPYGLAGYAFTTSHPTLLAWSRLFSLLLTVGLVATTFLLAWSLGLSPLLSGTAALLTATSPELVRNSTLIGVDVLMALFCAATVLFGVLCARRYHLWKFIACATCAGLACSSKYNAAPVCAVPLVAIFMGGSLSIPRAIISVLLPVVAFIAGSPYTVLSFDEFIRGVGYEVWHYSIAGHENHSAEPGLDQAMFYAHWLITDGLGVVASSFCLLGFLACRSLTRSMSLTFLAFPALYAAMMIMQRANFTRNMVAEIPFVALLAVLGIRWIAERRSIPIRAAATPLLCFAALAAPTLQSFLFVESARTHTDSRRELMDWLKNARDPAADVAVAGPLQLPISYFGLPGVDAYDPRKTQIESLFQGGFEFVAAPAWIISDDSTAAVSEVVRRIPGEAARQRIPDDPEIRLLRLAHPELLKPKELIVNGTTAAETLGCERPGEPYCWITTRVTSLGVGSAPGELVPALEFMSPWPNQIVTVTPLGTESAKTEISLQNGEEWIKYTPPVGTSRLLITTREVHAPASRGGGDSRRLGVAVRRSHQ